VTSGENTPNAPAAFYQDFFDVAIGRKDKYREIYKNYQKISGKKATTNRTFPKITIRKIRIGIEKHLIWQLFR
jgi:hypothetical protein